jgi:hypothetical protein
MTTVKMTHAPGEADRRSDFPARSAAWRILAAALLVLIVGLWPASPAVAATCAPAKTGGSAPTDWPAYCWLDFSTYNDTQARSASGQTLSYTLSDGSTFSFVVTVSSNVTTTTTALKGVVAPSWTGAAVGNTAFLGIAGSPILYTAASQTVTVTFSNITLTPPAGIAVGATYDFVAADGESTNGGESLAFTTNSGSWTVLDKVPPISGALYPTTTNTGTVFTETGVAGTVGGYIVGSTNATTVTTKMVASGLQGAMFALRYSAITLNSQVVGRTYAADQFKYSIALTSSGTTLSSATSSGTGIGPYTSTSTFITTPQSFTLSEVMASGSVSALGGYSEGLSCTNANGNSTTSLPNNVATTSYVLSNIQYGDSISCVFTNTANAPPPPDHYAVTTPGTAVNCAPAAVTITAHTATHMAFATTDTIALSTSTGHGDWTLTTGSGTFTAGAANSGTATYAYSATDYGAVVLALRDTYPETVTINVTDGSITAKSGNALAGEDSPLTFAPSGFRFTNGSNVATTIGTQVSGVTSTQSLALQAVRTDTNTGACTAVFASGTTVNVGLGYQCNNPSSCVSGQTFTVTNNSISTHIASNPGSAMSNYTTVPLKFSTANGEAPFTMSYSDAGQVTLAAKYAIPLGSGAASGNTMTGAGVFVVQPYTLKLSNLKRTSNGFANPAASTASGAVFIGAGQAFTATVTATNYQGNATPNFGQELSPATVELSSALVLPTSGHNPSVSGSFGAFTSGAATGTAFSWPEVGIITLNPGVTNYLSSGAITGTTSANIGRFIPNNFATTLNTPVFGTACSNSGTGSMGFTYIGQPFTYTVAPVITATAQALGGTTTQNYTGSLMRLANSSLTGRAYTPTPSSDALTLTGLPTTAADPAILDLGTGSVTLTFSAGSGLSFTRGTAIAPFSASIALSQNVIDLDSVAAQNPVTFGATGGIAFSAGATQLYGRLALRNSVGSELLDLPVPLTVQYYLGGTQGFTTNTADNCTVAPSASPAIAFGNYQLNLTSGETCVRDSGSPGASGLGCTAAAASGQRYSATASSGNFNLILAAPGSGNNGAVTVTADAPTWLQYLWSASSGSNSNPFAIATFGEFPGSASRVYQREVY